MDWTNRYLEDIEWYNVELSLKEKTLLKWAPIIEQLENSNDTEWFPKYSNSYGLPISQRVYANTISAEELEKALKENK